MRRMAIAASVLLAGMLAAPAAQADRTRVEVIAPAPAPAEMRFEAPVRGQVVCVFPDDDGGCVGTVIFRFLEEMRRETEPRPKPRSPQSDRPASGD